MTTTAEGNGAEVSASPKRSRPRIRRISCFMAKACHHLVSVRAGTRQTTVAFSCAAAWWALAIHRPICSPYGGFMKTASLAQDWRNPSSKRVKYLLHFAFASVEQGSKVKPNSRSNASNSH